MKCFVLVIALIGTAVAFPRPDKPANPQISYSPEPVQSYKPSSPYKADELPPQPYSFEYGVSDTYTGTNYKAIESQDDKGTVLGSYVVNLPDGRVQTVTYRADQYGGFVADVKYEGEAKYPPEPAEGYGNSYKVSKGYSEPAPKYVSKADA